MVHNPAGTIGMRADFMDGNHRREPRRVAVARYLAVFALTLAGVHVAATPTLAAAAKKAAVAAKPSAVAVEKWEGFWAKSRKDCLNQDGPDSKTMINLKGVENGRPAPLFDQYENHCRIDSHATKGNATRLQLTCFEFWDDYKARKNPRRDTVAVTVLGQQKIHINGNPFIRCKK
jgi:hypothetical protein